MKQKLLALVATLGALGAGTLAFINWDTGRQVQLPRGGFEVLDRSDCDVTTCNAAACIQANNILADAGSACTTRLVTCDVRVGAQAQAWAADAGLALVAKRYQRLRFVGARCPGVDGGSTFGIPMDNNGLPQFASLASVAPKCVRAPLDGGTNCRRVQADGGSVFFGTGNVFPADAGTGAQCEPVNCSVVFGDQESDL